MNKTKRLIGEKAKAEAINAWLDESEDAPAVEANERFDAGVARALTYIDMAAKGGGHIHDSINEWRRTFAEVIKLVQTTEDRMRALPMTNQNAGFMILMTTMIIRMNSLVAQATRQGLLRPDDAYEWANALPVKPSDICDTCGEPGVDLVDEDVDMCDGTTKTIRRHGKACPKVH